MEPKNLSELDNGDTLMLAREIMQRENVSQVYEKIDDNTVRHIETGEEIGDLPKDELVYPFEPSHVAKS